MSSHDRHYTPSQVATRLAAAVTCRNVNRIADFAVGGGDLLKAAETRWPKARYIGCDIDQVAIEGIKRQRPRWTTCNADFLGGHVTRERFEALNFPKFIDVILLNPPFSARKVKTVLVVLSNGDTIECSRAMAFVIRSINFCRIGGQIVAILPSGAVDSLRDEAAWRYLRGICQVDRLFKLSHKTFPECSASAEVFRFTHLRKIALATRKLGNIKLSCNSPDLVITRGSVSISGACSMRRKKIRVIHSTELQDYRVGPPKHYVAAAKTLNTKLYVLLPRVGRFRIDKICVFRPGFNFTLSDCVIGISARNDLDTTALHLRLINGAEKLRKSYRGTGAPYITIDRLGRFLTSLGYTWFFASRYSNGAGGSGLPTTRKHATGNAVSPNRTTVTSIAAEV